MHELGICDAILKTVDGIAQKEQLTAVSKITLEVGMLSGVVPRFLTDCWQAVIDGTPYQDTVLELEIINGLARCEDCGFEFSADLERLCCPKCAGVRLTPLTGTDLTIKEIEGD
jgi:hydrogenase nickel incorporation protein HypA/HybF